MALRALTTRFRRIRSISTPVRQHVVAVHGEIERQADAPAQQAFEHVAQIDDREIDVDRLPHPPRQRVRAHQVLHDTVSAFARRGQFDHLQQVAEILREDDHFVEIGTHTRHRCRSRSRRGGILRVRGREDGPGRTHEERLQTV
jgi:hypothetical protein